LLVMWPKWTGSIPSLRRSAARGARLASTAREIEMALPITSRKLPKVEKARRAMVAAPCGYVRRSIFAAMQHIWCLGTGMTGRFVHGSHAPGAGIDGSAGRSAMLRCFKRRRGFHPPVAAYGLLPIEPGDSNESYRQCRLW